MSDDPRELARQLAAQAKERLGQAESTEDPRALAQRLAAQAKAAAGGAPAQPTGKPLTAAQALQRAREERAAKQRSAPQPPPAPTPGRAALSAPRDPASMPPGGLDVRMVPRDPGDTVAQLVAELLPGASVLQHAAISNHEVFQALWRAHLARGRQEGDPQLVATASVLLSAVKRCQPGSIAAARISLRNQEWAAWVDLDRSLLLGVAQPADVFLAGV
ncbi:MAG: hypothetical protein KTR31_01135 [Myxococcales bacterium]|nr:hypothetical protein [Myxococcales bacterium]